MSRWLVLSGIVTIAVGLGFVFPAVAQLRDLGALPAHSVFLFLLGSLLTLGGVGSLAFGIRGARRAAP